MSKDLIVFDTLKVDIIELVAPARKIQVTDFKTSDYALTARNQIKALLKQIEAARDGLVRPLNEQVKAVNAYARNIEDPLKEVDSYLQKQVTAFAIEQEKIKQEAFRKAETERIAAERVANEKAQKEARERQRANELEIERIKAEAKEAEEMFGGKIDTSAQIQESLAAAERERQEAQTKFEQEEMDRLAKQKQAQYDASQQQIKGVRKNWKVRVVNIDLVPKEFLIVELNQNMALASARAGNTKIPGLEFYQETKIASGNNTYVPKPALLSDEK